MALRDDGSLMQVMHVLGEFLAKSPAAKAVPASTRSLQAVQCCQRKLRPAVNTTWVSLDLGWPALECGNRPHLFRFLQAALPIVQKASEQAKTKEIQS